MTDLRACLATVLMAHQYTGFGHCRCGHSTDRRGPAVVGHFEHVADVLLSLPDIAIVERNVGSLSEDVIAHVLADIDQVSNEDQWSLRQRLETIQKICDGSEYVTAHAAEKEDHDH